MNSGSREIESPEPITPHGEEIRRMGSTLRVTNFHFSPDNKDESFKRTETLLDNRLDKTMS